MHFAIIYFHLSVYSIKLQIIMKMEDSTHAGHPFGIKIEIGGTSAEQDISLIFMA